MKLGLSDPEFSGVVTGVYNSSNVDTDWHEITISDFTLLGPGSSLTSGDFIWFSIRSLNSAGAVYYKYGGSTPADPKINVLIVPTTEAQRSDAGTIIGDTISYAKSTAGDDIVIQAGFGSLT